MATEVFYVRNGRPNRVIVKFNKVKYLLERRGSREDTVSLPEDSRADPIVARFLRTGILEEISKEAFMTLAVRTEDRSYELDVVRAKDVAIPMGNETSSTPTVIADKDLAATAHLRSPRLDILNPVSTNVELGFEKPELSEEDKTENDKLRDELDEMKALVAKLLERDNVTTEVVEEPKAKRAPRKKATTATKSTRTTRSKKS